MAAGSVGKKTETPRFSWLLTLPITRKECIARSLNLVSAVRRNNSTPPTCINSFLAYWVMAVLCYILSQS